MGDGSNNPINGDSFLSDLNHDGIEVYSDPFAAMDAAQLAGLVGIMDELHIVYEMR